MTRFGRLAALCLGVSSAAAATWATAADLAAHSVVVSGHVPTVCHVELSYPAPRLPGKPEENGSIQRSCNSATGYRLIIFHQSSFRGSFEIDGRRVPASSSDRTVLEEVTSPRFGAVAFRVHDSNYGQAKKLFLSIVPNS